VQQEQQRQQQVQQVQLLLLDRKRLERGLTEQQIERSGSFFFLNK
jgi:hypothetical protein